MLKSLHLKNWRSIREATIDFTPITVLIGANASGKTNVLDALRFLSDINNNNLVQAVYHLGGGKFIKTLGVDMSEPLSIELKLKFHNIDLISDKLEMLFLADDFQFQARRLARVGDKEIIDTGYVQFLQSNTLFAHDINASNEANYWQEALSTLAFSRWQFLAENFMPPLRVSPSKMSNLLSIESDASNTIFLLGFMKQIRPELFELLQEDLRFLLAHLDHLSSKRTESELQIAFHENKYPEKEAPTVSAGTARILAILVAIYLLDIVNPEMSGLVVIEEPETSLNPSLLRKFVELLRGYTEDAEKPRQFILTTHNPAFLNYFEPEEVRVVSRDEDGNTVVNPIPDYIREIWLDEHGLGDAWLTNAFGGVAE